MFENLFHFSMVEIILLVVLCGLFAIQLYYNCIFYNRPRKEIQKNKRKYQSNYPPISIILYSNDNPKDLADNLDFFSFSNYPEFEFIVVNDGDNPECHDAVKLETPYFDQIYYTYVPKTTQYLNRKKLALTIGIKAAKYDYILFTDSQCFPYCSRWAKHIMRNMQDETDVVLGFPCYPYNDNLLDYLASYDTFMNNIQNYAAALSNLPYIGDGRSLLCRKSFLLKNLDRKEPVNLYAKGFNLLIDQNQAPVHTSIQDYNNNKLHFGERQTWRSWKEFKISRSNALHQLKRNGFFSHELESQSGLWFIILAWSSFGVGFSGSLLLSAVAFLLIILRYTARIHFFKHCHQFYAQPKVAKLFPILEICLPLYNGYIEISRLFHRKKYASIDG